MDYFHKFDPHCGKIGFHLTNLECVWTGVQHNLNQLNAQYDANCQLSFDEFIQNQIIGILKQWTQLAATINHLTNVHQIDNRKVDSLINCINCIVVYYFF